MKKHIVRGMAVALLSMTVAQAYTARTFLLPRSTSVNLPMEYTGFKRLTQEDKGAFGAYLQGAVFYGQSTNTSETAKYFLVNNKSTITLQLSANFSPVVLTPSTVTNDVDLGYIEHIQAAAADVTAFRAAGDPTLSLAPKQEAYGFTLAYHQKLGNTGWILDLALPIVNIENDSEFKFTGAVRSVPAFGGGLPFDIKQNLVQNFTGVPLTILPGGADIRANTFHTAAKLGKTRTAGASDLDVRLAYKVLDKVNCHAAFGAGLTVPMGNRPTGEFMFEAIRGNGRHVGLGADLDFDGRMWGNVEHNITFNVISHYRYLFTAEQTRTLGLKGRPFGQHYLLIQNNSTNPFLTPAANVLTVPVDVTGRSQSDTVFGFTYNNHALTADLGYNLYYRDAEVVRQRTSFQDNTWAVAARGYGVGAPVVFTGPVTVSQFDGGSVASAIVNDSTIDVSAAATPAQCTHSVYGNLGYMFDRESEYPWLLSVGGKYEWAERNSALEQWSVWAKAGLAF